MTVSEHLQMPSLGGATGWLNSDPLDNGRLYQLVRQAGEVQERTLEITFLDPGAEAYVFTFG
jgi:hypothetical protein